MYDYNDNPMTGEDEEMTKEEKKKHQMYVAERDVETYMMYMKIENDRARYKRMMDYAKMKRDELKKIASGSSHKS